MPDLTSQVLPVLRKHRIPNLDFGDGFIYPNYDGYSIRNLPASICNILGAPENQAPPLAPAVLQGVQSGIKRVLLVLVDALSFQRFARWMQDGTASLWQDLLSDGILSPITSVLPSTTSTCLPTIWTGLSPAQHGMVGYELWLKEYGIVANMIQHSPFTIQGAAGSLERAGFTPENELPALTLGTSLASKGIQSYAFQHFSIANSGLSRMFLKDTSIRPYSTPTDLWISLRQQLEKDPGEPQFIWAYWGTIDYMAHNYGPDHERCAAEFANFTAVFEENFLKPITAAARKDTLMILTADHGQIMTPKDPFYNLKNHPNLARRLHILPTGENRVMYMFIRPGQTEAVREYISRTFLNQFVQIDPNYAVEHGLFGPESPHPRLGDRIGDLIVLAKGDSYLWWGAKDNPIYGRHGGLSEDEMLVPFFAVHL